MILVRQIRPSIRLLCAGVGGFLLSGVGLWFQAYGPRAPSRSRSSPAASWPWA